MLPLAQAIQACTNKQSLEDIKSLLSDSFELLANASMDINISRKDIIRPELDKASHLANRDKPITAELFGDDVDQEFKKIEASNKLSDSMKKKRFSPYPPLKPYQNKAKFVQQIKGKAKSFLGGRAGNFNKSYPASQNSNKSRHNFSSGKRSRHNQHQIQKKKW